MKDTREAVGSPISGGSTGVVVGGSTGADGGADGGVAVGRLDGGLVVSGGGLSGGGSVVGRMDVAQLERLRGSAGDGGDYGIGIACVGTYERVYGVTEGNRLHALDAAIAMELGTEAKRLKARRCGIDMLTGQPEGPEDTSIGDFAFTCLLLVSWLVLLGAALWEALSLSEVR